MSATTQLVLGGALAGFQVFVVIALIVLFRRVASLQRASEALAIAIDPGDEDSEGEDEPSGQTERNMLATVGRQDQSSYSLAREGGQLTVHALSSGGERRRPREAVSHDAAVAAYNALASHFSQADFEAFEQRWHPEPIAHSADNGLADDPQGDFWLIRTGHAGDPHGLIVPGPDIVRKWEIYYRSMGSMAAKTLLEGLYEIGDGAPLRLEQPAIATLTDTGWEVEVPGTFADG